MANESTPLISTAIFAGRRSNPTARRVMDSCIVGHVMRNSRKGFVLVVIGRLWGGVLRLWARHGILR